jgi:hypothetical protein
MQDWAHFVILSSMEMALAFERLSSMVFSNSGTVSIRVPSLSRVIPPMHVIQQPPVSRGMRDYNNCALLEITFNDFRLPYRLITAGVDNKCIPTLYISCRASLPLCPSVDYGRTQRVPSDCYPFHGLSTNVCVCVCVCARARHPDISCPVMCGVHIGDRIYIYNARSHISNRRDGNILTTGLHHLECSMAASLTFRGSQESRRWFCENRWPTLRDGLHVTHSVTADDMRSDRGQNVGARRVLMWLSTRRGTTLWNIEHAVSIQEKIDHWC